MFVVRFCRIENASSQGRGRSWRAFSFQSPWSWIMSFRCGLCCLAAIGFLMVSLAGCGGVPSTGDRVTTSDDPSTVATEKIND